MVFDYGSTTSIAYTKCYCDSDKKAKPLNTTSFVVLEKGNYVDNKKQGEWIYYNRDGSVERKLIYKDDLPITDSIATD